MQAADLQDIELELFIRAMQRRYGYDFSDYAPASFKRRVLGVVEKLGFANISQLNEAVIYDDGILPRIIEHLSVPVSSMFRDPEEFLFLRQQVLPALASYPFINIWQAGCAGGEEVYSLAILLHEEGLYERCQIYATDFNDQALANAAGGIYPLRNAREYIDNYHRAGGRGSLADYYHARYGHLRLDERLRRNVTFVNHNLVADKVFAEMHLILCRNVLIYFNNRLQEQVLTLFADSLARGGYLVLGTKESLYTSQAGERFRRLAPRHAIYQLKSVAEPVA